MRTNLKPSLLAVALTALSGASLPAAAADEAVLAEIKRLAERIEVLEKRNHDLETALASDRITEKEPEVATRLKAVETQLSDLKGPATKLAEATDGIEVGGGVVAVVQSLDQDGASHSRSNYRGDVEISIPAGDGTFFTHFRVGQGDGITAPGLSGPNGVAFNADNADAHAILAQAWYQQSLAIGGEDSGQSVAVTVGKIDSFGFFDQNAIADDEGAKFMNNIFVHNPLLDAGGDIAADDYGFAPGIVLQYVNEVEKGSEWGLSLGAFSSGDGANFGGQGRLSYLIGQAEMNTRLNMLPGTLRLYAWSNDRADDYDGDDDTTITARHAGWGLSVDQKVTDDLTLFGRYGRSTQGKLAFDRGLTLGAELEGTGWGRAADSVGLAWGSLRTGSDYRTTAGVDGNEKVMELYYRYKLNDAVELSPSYQWIDNPGGSSTAKTAKLYGLRASLGF